MYTIDILNMSFRNVSLVLGFTVLTGLLIALTYWFTHRRTGFRSSVLLAATMIAPIVSVVIMAIYAIIGNNLARAISIGGGLALIRFRNNLDDPRDMIYLYLSLAAGVVGGTGMVGVGILCISALCVILAVFSLTGFDRLGGRAMKLRILVPENINFEGMFDETLRKYCRFHNLDRVKTADYGTVLELQYRITMKKPGQQKALIDELRTHNANLDISITQNITED